MKSWQNVVVEVVADNDDENYLKFKSGPETKKVIGLCSQLVGFSEQVTLDRSSEGDKVVLEGVRKVTRAKGDKITDFNPPLHVHDVSLGSGGQGSIMLGTYGAEFTPAAVKKCGSDTAALKSEHDILKKLASCPYIVQVIDYRPSYLVLELAEMTLADLMLQDAHKDGLGYEDLMRCARHVLTGLVVMHDANIIHKDLKPANLLIFYEDGAMLVKIADFGVSTEIAGEVCDALGHTTRYAGPERVVPLPDHSAYTRAYNKQTDIYSFCAVMLEMLIGCTKVQTSGNRITFEANTEQPKVAHLRDTNMPLYEAVHSGMHELSCLRPFAQELHDVVNSVQRPCPEHPVTVYCIPVTNVQHVGSHLYMKCYRLGEVRTPGEGAKRAYIMPSKYEYCNEGDPDMKLLTNGGYCQEYGERLMFFAFSSSGEESEQQFVLDPSCSKPYEHDKDEEYRLSAHMPPRAFGGIDARFMVLAEDDKVLLLYGATPLDADPKDRLYEVAYRNTGRERLVQVEARYESITAGAVERTDLEGLEDVVRAAVRGEDERLLTNVNTVQALVMTNDKPAGCLAFVDLEKARVVDPSDDAERLAVEVSELEKLRRDGKFEPVDRPTNGSFGDYVTWLVSINPTKQFYEQFWKLCVGEKDASKHPAVPAPFKGTEQQCWSDLNSVLLAYDRMKGDNELSLKWAMCRQLIYREAGMAQHFVPMLCFMEADEQAVPIEGLYGDGVVRWRHMMGAVNKAGYDVVRDPVNPEMWRHVGRKYAGEVALGGRIVRGGTEPVGDHEVLFEPFSNSPVQEVIEVGGNVCEVRTKLGKSKLHYKVGDNIDSRSVVLERYHGYDKVAVVAELLFAYGVDLGVVSSKVQFIVSGGKTIEICKEHDSGSLRSTKPHNVAAGIALLHLHLGIPLQDIHFYPSSNRIQHNPLARSNAASHFLESLPSATTHLAKYQASMAFIIASHNRYVLNTGAYVKRVAPNKDDAFGETFRGYKQGLDNLFPHGGSC